MKTVQITSDLREKLDDSEIKVILNSSVGNSDYDVQIDLTRKFGQYLVVEDNDIKKYILISSKRNDGRNAYISQSFSTAYSDFVLDQTSKEKIFEVFLFYVSRVTDTPYNKFFYRLIKTCDIRILNEIDLLGSTIERFSNYFEIESLRRKVGKRNSSNKPTYFSDEEDHINVFGKVFGANGKESAFICFALNKISDKPIWFYQVFENNSDAISNKDLRALEILGVKIMEKIPEVDNPGVAILNFNEKDLRDTPKFHYNLLKKFDMKKCYLCSCDIGSMIIGAHIHRVADIKTDDSIDTNEKIKQIVDGDNGFWLCADHDKLFEVGLIFFKENQLMISNKLNQSQVDFVKKITDHSEISNIYYTPNTQKYIDLHFNRTQN